MIRVQDFDNRLFQYTNKLVNNIEMMSESNNENDNTAPDSKPVLNLENHSRAATAPSQMIAKPSAASLEPRHLSSPARGKTVKVSREFYQKNTNAVAVVAAVILGAGIQTLLGATDDYNAAENMLFMVCILEGLCLFFSNLIMMVTDFALSVY